MIQQSAFVGLHRRLLFAFAFLISVSSAQEKDARPPILRQVGIDQKLNEQLPLDLTFRDEAGKPVVLKEFFGNKPVVLSFAYYECPMLCTLVLNDLVKAIRAIPLELGSDFVAVNISINPRESPSLAGSTKKSYVRAYGRPKSAAAWHFLTGDEVQIRRAADAAGFRYAYDPSTGQYVHAAAIIVLTPQGKMARYFTGLEFAPRDLRLALVEAAGGKIGSPIDQVLLYCFHYDPVTGKYGFVVMNAVRALGIATVLFLGGFIIIMVRREKHA